MTNEIMARSPWMRLGKALSYRAVTMGGFEVAEGEAAWALSRPADRWPFARRICNGFTTELLSTSPACERFGVWFDCARPHYSRPALRRSMTVIGLRGIVYAAIVDLVSRLPGPVQHHVVSRAWIIGVGRDAAGFCEPAPPAPEQLQLICIDGTLSVRWLRESVLPEEIAHQFLCRTEPTPPTMAERRRRVVKQRELAREWDMAELPAEFIRHDETLAARLVASWQPAIQPQRT
jgi:hypothetical protein